MAIITYWNDGKNETGQSMTIAAVATAMAWNYNYKVLIVNTKHADPSLEFAFEQKNNVNRIFSKGKMDLATGLSGVAKAIMSNKTSPEIITNYTKVIWKNLELLTDKDITDEEFEKFIKYIKEIIKLANRYYDMVFVDLEGPIDDPQISEILSMSTINVVTLTQNINVLDRFKEYKGFFRDMELFVSIGRYDDKSKYTVKNVSKYINEKKVFAVPYNTMLAMEAPEGKLDDFFINFRNVKGAHPNAPLIEAVNDQAHKIVDTIKAQQRKIY